MTDPGDADFTAAAADQAMVDAAYVDLAREQRDTDAEAAGHCGHADLLRECIDGRVGQQQRPKISPRAT